MADSNFTSANNAAVGASCFKEAVCVNAGRVYDSCSAKDCLEDLRVVFTEAGQAIVETAQSIKCRSVEVLNVFMDVEAIPFNKGFYSVDMTYYFLITLDVYTSNMAPPAAVQGIAAFNKKVILYGSEGSVKTFSSTAFIDPAGDCTVAADCPAAKVQVVNPILLSCRLCDAPLTQTECIPAIPTCILRRIGGGNLASAVTRYIYVSVGIFSIVQLERDVQMMIPVYDFCLPDKECTAGSCGGNEDPCELFRRIKFPVNEFFPPRLAELDCEETIS
ncbi:MAG: hypothetical protein ACOX6P_01100 [Candidatus Merdivicinus sp.]|jgi:hypothetical protein